MPSQSDDKIVSFAGTVFVPKRTRRGVETPDHHRRIELEINVSWLIRQIGLKAAENSSGKSGFASGAVKAKAIGQRIVVK